MFREPSSSLFPTDRPLSHDLLMGRAEDVREIAATLSGGGHVVISGPRRTGKTSVCDAALDTLEGEGHYVVSVDLFRIASAAELAEALVARTIANRSVLRRILHRTREAGRLAADTAGVSAVVKSKLELGEELEIAFTPNLARRDPNRFLDYALDLPGRIAKADGKRVIVFFDEFQEIAGSRAPYGDSDAVTKRMRAIFQRSPGVSVLFAGSIEHLMRDLFTPRQRALSQFGSFHELRPIAAEDWAAGLRGRFELDGCELDELALWRLVELGSGHPRATMLIAQKAHLTSVLLDARDIDLAIVEQGYRAAIEGERVSHEQTVERLRGSHQYALQVARRIANGEPPYRDLPSNSVRRALEKLRNIGIARSEGREWSITDPLLAHFLSELDPLS
jgi:uncharacterized protein